MKRKEHLIKNALILFAITLVAGLALSFVYSLTKEPIAKAADDAKQKAYQEVYPGVSFEPVEDAESLLDTLNDTFVNDRVKEGGVSLKRVVVSEVLRAVDENGAAVGYVTSLSTTSGYNGEITAAVGVSADGALTGFTVLSHSETAGLGAKCADKEYQKTFVGLRSAANMDMISGATFTSTALKELCGAALYVVREAESGVTVDV